VSDEIHITVPMTPPGVNHYVKHTRTGRHYVTAEAGAFKTALALVARGRWIMGKSFEVEAFVYLGSGQKGDVDGFSKLLLDGLQEAGVFRSERLDMPPLSDSYVTDLIMRKRRDRENPRTEITVRSI